MHPIEKLWREVGLPEYFLGNGGTNTKLYELHARILEECATIAQNGAKEHVIEAWAGVEFSEERVEALLERYAAAAQASLSQRGSRPA